MVIAERKSSSISCVKKNRSYIRTKPWMLRLPVHRFRINFGKINWKNVNFEQNQISNNKIVKLPKFRKKYWEVSPGWLKSLIKRFLKYGKRLIINFACISISIESCMKNLWYMIFHIWKLYDFPINQKNRFFSLILFLIEHKWQKLWFNQN